MSLNTVGLSSHSPTEVQLSYPRMPRLLEVLRLVLTTDLWFGILVRNRQNEFWTDRNKIYRQESWSGFTRYSDLLIRESTLGPWCRSLFSWTQQLREGRCISVKHDWFSVVWIQNEEPKSRKHWSQRYHNFSKVWHNQIQLSNCFFVWRVYDLEFLG